MAEYIDRQKLKERLEDFSKWCRDSRKQGVDFVLDCPLPDIPTEDVVPVVRCSQCKHWWKENELCLHPKCCHGKVAVVFADSTHFCSYGERKE